MSKVLIYSQEDLDLILELEKEKNEQLQQENRQLKMINKEYERLNKESGKGFKITNVQEYNIDELLSFKNYKDNWNKLKMWLNSFHRLSAFEQWEIVNKMQELQGSDNDE